MSVNLIQAKSPEEQELERLRAAFAQLEAELIQRESDFATIHADLAYFEQQYQARIGTLYGELDAINAQIERELTDQPRKQPTESLKKLHREVAKAIHPDLAIDEDDRKLRERLMTEANQAYERGDEERLRAILEEYRTKQRSSKPETTLEQEIKRLRAMIGRIQARLRFIEDEMYALMLSEAHQLLTRVKRAALEGRDLLKEMAARLEGEIAHAREHLARIKAEKQA